MLIIQKLRIPSIRLGQEKVWIKIDKLGNRNAAGEDELLEHGYEQLNQSIYATIQINSNIFHVVIDNARCNDSLVRDQQN